MTLLEAAEEARQFLSIMANYSHIIQHYPETARKCRAQECKLSDAIEKHVK